jgi:hypothetical protein
LHPQVLISAEQKQLSFVFFSASVDSCDSTKPATSRAALATRALATPSTRTATPVHLSTSNNCRRKRMIPRLAPRVQQLLLWEPSQLVHLARVMNIHKIVTSNFCIVLVISQWLFKHYQAIA